MKKFILLLIVVAINMQLNAQAQRTILFEQFTGENCGPCAAIWPQVETLWKANESKVIMMKFQTPIPSAGNICGLFAGESVRRAYYSCNSAPWAQQDGKVIDATQTSPTHPAYWTQAIIDARYAVTSPLELSVAHTYNANKSALVVDFTYKNVSIDNILTGTHTMHIAMVEDTLAYTTAPGTNGELIFHRVVRDMKPSASGQPFPPTAAGASVTSSVNFTIPTYVRDKSLLRIIMFVQNNNTKEVIQAAMSPLVTLPNPTNAVIAADFSGTTSLCDSLFTPQIKLFNKGTTPINRMAISYGTPKVTYKYTNTLAVGDSSAVITLNPVVLTPNAYTTVAVTIDSINGTMTDDITTDNTTAIQRFVTKRAAQALPMTETFETLAVGGTSYPTGASSAASDVVYAIDKSVTTATTNNLGGFGASNFAMRYRPFNANFFGYSANLYFNKLDLTNIPSGQVPFMKFDYASAMKDATSIDSVIIEASSDCGTNWTRVKATTSDKYNTSLDANNAPVYKDYSSTTTNGLYYPDPNHWRRDSINLGAFKGLSSVMVRFRYKITSNTSAQPSNHFYMDNISFYSASGTATGRNILVQDTVSITKYNASTLPVADSGSHVYNYFTNCSVGELISWKVTGSGKPANWNIVSICDNFVCIPFTNTIGNTFTYKTGVQTNFLYADIRHYRNPGYGYVNIKTWAKTDSAATLKNMKISMLVSNGSSISMITDASDKMLTYFDGKMFVDNDFAKATLQIYDINGKQLMNTVIHSDNIDFTAPKGIYIARISREGQAIKSVKFSIEK